MNELLFIFHILCICVFLLFSLRIGKIALIIFCVLQILFSNFFILKQISLFGLTVTATDAYAIGALFGLNVLQSYYGKSIAKKTILFSFLGLFCFLLMSLFHLFYQPSAYDTFHVHYQKILSLTPRLIFSSFFVFFISSHLDIWIFSKIKKVSFPLRSFISVSLSQLVDTVLFSFIGLYGIMQAILHVIVMSYAVKLIGIIVMVAFTAVCKKIKHPSVQDEISL